MGKYSQMVSNTGGGKYSKMLYSTLSSAKEDITVDPSLLERNKRQVEQQVFSQNEARISADIPFLGNVNIPLGFKKVAIPDTIYKGIQELASIYSAPSDYIGKGLEQLGDNPIAGAINIGQGVAHGAFSLTGFPQLLTTISTANKTIFGEKAGKAFDDVMNLPAISVQEGTKQLDKVFGDTKTQIGIFRGTIANLIATGRPEMKVLTPLLDLDERRLNEISEGLNEVNQLGATLLAFKGLDKIKPEKVTPIKVTEELRGKEATDMLDKQTQLQSLYNERNARLKSVDELKGSNQQFMKSYVSKLEERIKPLEDELGIRATVIENSIPVDKLTQEKLPLDLLKEQESKIPPSEKEMVSLRSEVTKKNGEITTEIKPENTLISSIEPQGKEIAPKPIESIGSSITEEPKPSNSSVFVEEVPTETKFNTTDIIKEASTELNDKPINIAQKSIKIDDKIYSAPEAVNHKQSWDKAVEQLGAGEVSKAFAEGRISVMDEKGNWRLLNKKENVNEQVQRKANQEEIAFTLKSFNSIKDNETIKIDDSFWSRLKNKGVKDTEVNYLKSFLNEGETLKGDEFKSKVNEKLFPMEIKEVSPGSPGDSMFLEMTTSGGKKSKFEKPTAYDEGLETPGIEATNYKVLSFDIPGQEVKQVHNYWGDRKESVGWARVEDEVVNGQKTGYLNVNEIQGQLQYTEAPKWEDLKIGDKVKLEGEKWEVKNISNDEYGKTVEVEDAKGNKDSFGSKWYNKKKEMGSQQDYLESLKPNFHELQMKSLIQYAEKNGYKGVRFPTKESISKIEGFGDVEGQLKRSNEYVNELKKDYDSFSNENDYAQLAKVFNKYGSPNEYLPGDIASMSPLVKEATISERKQYIENKITSESRHIKDMQNALEGNIRPVQNFYEESVGMSGRKIRKDNWNRIRDAYGNEWFETKIEPKRDAEPITLYSTIIPLPHPETLRAIKTKFDENLPIVKDVLSQGARLVYEGTRDFKDWSAEMSKLYGDAIQPHLQRIWLQTQGIAQNDKNQFAQDLLRYAESKNIIPSPFTRAGKEILIDNATVNIREMINKGATEEQFTKAVKETFFDNPQEQQRYEELRNKFYAEIKGGTKRTTDEKIEYDNLTSKIRGDIKSSVLNNFRLPPDVVENAPALKAIYQEKFERSRTAEIESIKMKKDFETLVQESRKSTGSKYDANVLRAMAGEKVSLTPAEEKLFQALKEFRTAAGKYKENITAKMQQIYDFPLTPRGIVEAYREVGLYEAIKEKMKAKNSREVEHVMRSMGTQNMFDPYSLTRFGRTEHPSMDILKRLENYIDIYTIQKNLEPVLPTIARLEKAMENAGLDNSSTWSKNYTKELFGESFDLTNGLSGNKQINTALRTLNTMASIRYLAFNPVGGLGNLIGGMVQNVVSKDLSLKELATGTKRLTTTQGFDILTERGVVDAPLMKEGSIKDVGKTLVSPFAMYGAGEHIIQGISYLGKLTPEEFRSKIISASRDRQILEAKAQAQGGYHKGLRPTIVRTTIGKSAMKFRLWVPAVLESKVQKVISSGRLIESVWKGKDNLTTKDIANLKGALKEAALVGSSILLLNKLPENTKDKLGNALNSAYGFLKGESLFRQVTNVIPAMQTVTDIGIIINSIGDTYKVDSEYGAKGTSKALGNIKHLAPTFLKPLVKETVPQEIQNIRDMERRVEDVKKRAEENGRQTDIDLWKILKDKLEEMKQNSPVYQNRIMKLKEQESSRRQKLQIE